MDNTISFSELILKFWDTILKFVWPLYFRHEGFYTIKKTCEKPVKIYKDNERWCWKFPFFQTFDIVDMRHQTFNCTAHSFGCNNRNVIPYNIVIDTQIEFRIKDPLVIYRFNNDFTNQINPLYLFVSNKVHQLLSECFNTKLISDLDLNTIQRTVDNELGKLSRIDKNFCQNIEINKIIITSCDFNISLRQIQ